MRTFIVRLNHEFCEQDFAEAPVWATYYEPDEIDTLVGLGFDRKDIERAVSDLAHGNDEISFPLPIEAAEEPFHYLYLGVHATTRGGNHLAGFITGPCFAVFHDGKTYHFNAALRSRALEAAAELGKALDERNVFPMQVEVIATGERREEDLY